MAYFSQRGRSTISYYHSQSRPASVCYRQTHGHTRQRYVGYCCGLYRALYCYGTAAVPWWWLIWRKQGEHLLHYYGKSIGRSLKQIAKHSTSKVNILNSIHWLLFREPTYITRWYIVWIPGQAFEESPLLVALACACGIIRLHLTHHIVSKDNPIDVGQRLVSAVNTISRAAGLRRRMDYYYSKKSLTPRDLISCFTS